MHRRALVVDDEPAVCQLIHDVMNSVGTNVLALTKSADAANNLRDEKFDVVLLDLRMPALMESRWRGKRADRDSTA